MTRYQKGKVDMKSLLNYIQLKKIRFLQMAAIVAGAFLFGMIVHDVILFFVATESEDVFCLGTLMMVMMLVAAACFIDGMRFSTDFNYAIGMGQTRRTFLLMDAVTELCIMLALSVEIQLLYQIEAWKLRTFYAAHAVERMVEPLMVHGHLTIFTIAVTAFGMFIGALVQRIGKAAFWIVWVLWMAACIGGPRLIEAVEHGSDSQAAALAAQAVSQLSAPGLLAAAGLIISVIFLAAYVLLLRRAQVTS